MVCLIPSLMIINSIFANSLLECIREFGLQQVSDAMPQWFETFSEKGSDDDITVVVASTDCQRGNEIWH